MPNISALMDGELDATEAAREIARLRDYPDVAGDHSSREKWDAYHLIGDVMRGDVVVGAPGFGARFSERLALEPTVLAPRARLTRKVQTYALSAAASLAGAAAVVWVALSTPGPFEPNAASGELAKASVAQPQIVALQPQIVEPQPALAAAPSHAAKSADKATENFHVYMLAHQGISPTTAIQGVTPYIRTVSNTGD